jgi:hypothetical protein
MNARSPPKWWACIILVEIAGISEVRVISLIVTTWKIRSSRPNVPSRDGRSA